jgi:hypothetical protein
VHAIVTSVPLSVDTVPIEDGIPNATVDAGVRGSTSKPGRPCEHGIKVS